jgi:hypothetical protein
MEKYSSFSNKQASKTDRMAEVAKKRKVSSVEDKVNVIKEIESGKKMLMCTSSEALETIGTVNRFYEARSENTKIISEIGKIKDDLEKQYWTKRKQKKITDFFV